MFEHHSNRRRFLLATLSTGVSVFLHEPFPVNAQDLDQGLLTRIQILIDAEFEVGNGKDGEESLKKIDFDEDEKMVARESLKERKFIRDFLKSRKLENELLNPKATVKLISAETRGNKRILEVLISEEAEVAGFMGAESKYRGSRRLQFSFNMRSGRLRLSKRVWLDSPEETYKLQASSTIKLPAGAIPLNMDEYLSNLANTQSKQNLGKSYPSKHDTNSNLKYKAQLGVTNNFVAQTRTLNRSAMSQYMIKWTGDDEGGGYNPKFIKYDNDCTNYASQILEAGGWPRVGSNTIKNSAADIRYWYTTTPLNVISPRQSETWTVAPMLYQFINVSGRATPVSSASLLNVGDIIFVGRKTALTIGHTMIVCAKSSQGKIFISQHTSNRYMLPLADSFARWLNVYSDTQFYTWKLKDTF